MANHQIKIRIVAAVDSSLTGVFTSMATAAKRAGKKIGDEMGAGAEGAQRSQTRALVALKRQEARDLAKAESELTRDLARMENEQHRERLTKARDQQRALISLKREEASALAKIERQSARDQRETERVANAPGFWTKKRHISFAGSVASRVGMGAIGMGMHLGADLLHGIGVNTDMASMFAEAQKNQTLFRNISSFGYMPGTGGRNAERVDPETLLHEAHKIGQRTGFSAGEVGEGLEKFVGLTGDLDLGRESLEHMAVLSKATGSNLADMVEAAGAASNSLGNMPNKAEVLYDVMKSVASEGKTGAILIKDMAVQMAKIASASQMFAGDRQHTIGVLGAMAQEARGRGGAASATQAATAVSQFTNVFKKRQRLDTFTGFGMKVYDPGGGIRDPQELIVESFLASMKGGHRLTPAGKAIAMPGASGQKDMSRGWQNFETNLTALYGDVKAMRATAGFEDAFKQGYTGTKGTEQEKLAAATQAVNDEFRRLTIDMMDEKTVQEDFQLAMQNSKSKVAVFNDQIQEIAEDFEKELLPAVVTLGPEMVLLAKGASNLAQLLLGIAPPAPPPGMGGENYTSDATVKAARLHGKQSTEAAEKALELVGKRGGAPLEGLGGKSLGFDATEGAGTPVYSNAVSIPGSEVNTVNEYKAQLGGAVAAARARVKAAREARAKGLGVSPELSDAQISKIESERPGYDSDKTKEVAAAEKQLVSAEQMQAFATQVSAGIAQALANGTLRVAVVEDQTKKPVPGTQAGQPAMPSDSN